MSTAARRILGLAAALMLVLVGSAAPSAASNADERPFKAIGAGEVVFLEDAGCGLVATLGGSGPASHLGLSQGMGEHCASTFPAGSFTLIAANGDALFFDYTTEDECTYAPDFSSGECHSQAAVTGGTGRFLGATGWADFHVEFEVTGFGPPPMVWPAEYWLTGGIVY
jgi:hypothetical protein